MRQISIQILISSGPSLRSLQDRKLHALRHREGMGKNWRSYRRGYGRRFVWTRDRAMRCLLKHWTGAAVCLPNPLQLLQFCDQPKKVLC